MRVVVYIQPGTVGADRQLRILTTHCVLHGWDIASIVRPATPEQAVTLVLAGVAAFVLVAYAARPRPGDIQEACVTAGVDLAYVRPPATGAVRLDLAGMYHRSGGDVPLLAALLGVPPGQVRAALARAGVRNELPPPPHGRRGRHNRS